MELSYSISIWYIHHELSSANSTEGLFVSDSKMVRGDALEVLEVFFGMGRYGLCIWNGIVQLSQLSVLILLPQTPLQTCRKTLPHLLRLLLLLCLLTHLLYYP